MSSSVVILDNHTADIYHDGGCVSRLHHIEHMSIQNNNVIFLRLKNGDVLAIYGDVDSRIKRNYWTNFFRNPLTKLGKRLACTRV